MLHKDQQNIRIRESGRATETWRVGVGWGGRVIVFVAMQEIRQESGRTFIIKPEWSGGASYGMRCCTVQSNIFIVKLGGIKFFR